MADKFEDLRTYVAIVSCGGVNAAAAELGIAKSAVSRRLSDLEARLGTTLIDRAARRFEVTATGRAYFDGASDLLSRLDALDADPASQTASGVVTLAVEAAVARHLLAGPIAAFLRDRARLAVRLTGPDEPADVAFTTGGNSAGTRIADVRATLCAAPSHLKAHGTPATAGDLAGRAGVLLPGQNGRWKFSGESSRAPRSAITADDADTALSLAIAGAGIAQLPDFVIADAIAAGTLVALLEQDKPKPDQLVAVVSRDAPPVAHALVDELAKALAGRR